MSRGRKKVKRVRRHTENVQRPLSVWLHVCGGAYEYRSVALGAACAACGKVRPD